MSLNVTAFPACCGIFIIHGFGRTAAALESNHSDCTELETELSSLITKHSSKVSYSNKCGLLMVTLNSDQIPLYQDILLKVGFKVAEQPFYHPGHKNSIVVYTYVVHKEESYGKVNELKVTNESSFGKIFGTSEVTSKPVVRRRTKPKQPTRSSGLSW